MATLANSAIIVLTRQMEKQMKVITATEAKNSFGELLMNAQSEPVSITRNGKEQGVLLSSKEYSTLKAQILQAAVQAGRDSGSHGALNIDEIKKEARRRA